jgi:YVTN family beta-propeller protein
MNVGRGVSMTLVCKGKLAALLFCFFICVACGDTYRPTIIPQPVPTPNPKNFHSAFTVNQNGAVTLGTGLQVNVSGDSAAGVTHVALMPVYATLLSGRVWVANQGSDSVSVFSPAAGSNAPIGASTDINLPAGAAPVFLASTENATMYVANSGLNTVTAINTTTNAITNTIAVGTHPISLAEMPDTTLTAGATKKLYVVNRDDSSVTVVNTVDKTVSNTINFPAGASPRWAAMRADGARVYILSHNDGMLRTIDTLSLLPPDPVIGSTSVGAGADFLYYDSRRSRLYVPNPTNSQVGIYDASTDPPTNLATIDLTAAIPGGGGAPCPATGCSPVSVAALPDGTRAYIASFYIDNTSANCQQTPCLQSQVTVVDELTNQVTKTIPLPEGSVSPVGNCGGARFRISAASAIDGSRVYVSSCDAGQVASINPSGDVYFASIPAPTSAFSPTLMTITGATQNGSSTTYNFTYSITSPNTPIYLGLVVTITGVSQAADNGTFTVTGLGNGTFTVSNSLGVSTTGENGSGVGEPPNQNPVLMLTGS